MNPSAKIQIQQYAQSVSDLFKLMIQEKEIEFRTRVKKVKTSLSSLLESINIYIIILGRRICFW